MCSSDLTTRRTSLVTLPVSSIGGSKSCLLAGGSVKPSRMASKRGEVAGLRVERAVGIERRPPPLQRTPKRTSWRFGSLEKSKDRSKVSRPSMSEGSISVNTSHARTRRNGGIYRSKPPTKASPGSLHTLPRAAHSGGGIRVYRRSPRR